MRKKLTTTGLALLMGVLGGSARAAVQDDLRADLRQVDLFFSERIAEGLAFNAASAPLGNADTLKILGVELGLTGHASAMDVDEGDYRALPLLTIDNQGNQVEVPDEIGVPNALIHARVGLPWGMDLGLKAGGFDHDDTDGDASFDYENKVFGLELRKRLMGGSGVSGAALPDLSLSLALDSAKGELNTKDHYSGALKGGVNTLDADLIGKTEWEVGAATVRLLLSKTVAIFTPYASIGLTKHSGDAKTTLATVGTLNGAAVNESVSAESDADDGYGSVTLGGEVAFFPFFRVNLGFLLAEEKRAAALGLNFHFR